MNRPATCSAFSSEMRWRKASTRARAHNPDAGSAAAAEHEAGARLAEARSGYLPRVDASEAWQRGTHPVAG